MPDDSNEGFKHAQAAHAAAKHFERELMDKLGVTRSQARKLLQGQFNPQGRQDNGPAVQPALPIQPAPVAIPPSMVKFDPRPFLQKGDTGKGGRDGADGEQGPQGNDGDPGVVPDGDVEIVNDGESFVTITGSWTDQVLTLNFVWMTSPCSGAPP